MIDLITEKEIPNLPLCAATAQKGRKKHISPFATTPAPCWNK
jgi:hypothetical protein